MADGIKVRGRTPFVTPWRTIQLADKATDLAPSVLGLNLNPPNALASTDWIHPMKYVGIWWGMHIGTMTWSSGPKHGATTENTKRYIDFAAANGFGGVLVEGWNTGWDGDWIANRNAFSFTQAYPDYDLKAVAAYAKEKGVRLIVHNETSGGIQNYERQLDSAFTLYRSLGLDAIKSGYVTDLTSEGHSHYSQYMVRHYRHVIETAARYGIMLDVHEPMHDTGERRTYPNMMSREGARGQEYNAWSGDGGNPPEHETILFFTRLLAGPMDFTPGDLRHPDRAKQWTCPPAGGAAGPHHAGQAARAVRRDLLTAADGGRSPRELRAAARLPVHPRRRRGLGHDPGDRWPDRRLRGGRAPGARRPDLVRGRHHRRGGAHPRRPALVPDAGQAVRRRDLCRRPEGATGWTIPCRSPSRSAPVTSATRLRVVLAPGAARRFGSGRRDEWPTALQKLTTETRRRRRHGDQEMLCSAPCLRVSVSPW